MQRPVQGHVTKSVDFGPILDNIRPTRQSRIDFIRAALKVNFKIPMEGINQKTFDIKQEMLEYAAGANYGWNNLAVIDLSKRYLDDVEVVGDLANIETEQGTLIAVYHPSNFSDDYRREYPAFFLENNAPDDVQDLFYNPVEVSFLDLDYQHTYKTIGVSYRQKQIDSDYYLSNFRWLHNKYLDRFDINEVEREKIEVINHAFENGIRVPDKIEPNSGGFVRKR